MNQARTEKEKMLAGDLYNAQDPVLIADRLHSASLIHKYNSTPHHPGPAPWSGHPSMSTTATT